MIELDQRYTYEKLIELGVKSKNGEIYLNMDRCPILIKHPVHNIFTIFGYSKTTLKVSFAQTIDEMFLQSSPSIAKTYHDPYEVQKAWDSMHEQDLAIRIGTSQTIQKYVQEFLFSQKFKYEGAGQNYRTFHDVEVMFQLTAFDRKIQWDVSASAIVFDIAYPEAITFAQFFNKYLTFKSVSPYAPSLVN